MLTLTTIISFGVTINIIWFFHQVAIGWPLNLTSFGYSKFMKVICAFGELAKIVHLTLVQIHTVLVNSKVLIFMSSAGIGYWCIHFF